MRVEKAVSTVSSGKEDLNFVTKVLIFLIQLRQVARWVRLITLSQGSLELDTVLSRTASSFLMVERTSLLASLIYSMTSIHQRRMRSRVTTCDGESPYVEGPVKTLSIAYLFRVLKRSYFCDRRSRSRSYGDDQIGIKEWQWKIGDRDHISNIM